MRPIAVAADLGIVRCLPVCCGYTSLPCSLPFPGLYDARPIRCDPQHDDLGSWPDDLWASLLATAPLLAMPPVLMTSIVLVKLWLAFSWGSSSTGFTLSLLLPVFLHLKEQAPKPSTNKQHVQTL